MSESLTDGFLKSELNDHNPESSIDRILAETRIDSETFRNYLIAAFSESPLDVLDKLGSALHEVANEALEQKLAAVVPLLPEGLFPKLSDLLFFLKRDISEIPKHFRDSAQALKNIENDVSSLHDPLWYMQVPSKQAELIATHIWPADPIRFFEFANKHCKLHESKWDPVFLLYGDSLYEVLFDHLESQGLEGSLDAEPWIWDSWGHIRDQELSYVSYKERMIASVDWHKRLVNLGLMPLAQRFEQRCPSMSGEHEEGFNFHREKIQLMEWNRMSAWVNLELKDECRTLIERAFQTRNSFLGEDCSEELAGILAKASVRAFPWEYNLSARHPVVENAEALKQSGAAFGLQDLHEIWYSSRFRELWLLTIDEYLGDCDVATKINILNYVLKVTYWRVGNFYECPDGERDKWEESLPEFEVEQVHKQHWYAQVTDLGKRFLNREVRLDYENLVQWIKVTVDHGSHFGVKREELVPYADRELAFLRPYLIDTPEGFKIESCEMAYRILLTYAPDRLLRNLLPVLVKAEVPYSGEKLEYGAGSGLHVASQNPDRPIQWWVSVMISNALRVALAWEKRSEYAITDIAGGVLSTEEIHAVKLNLRKAFAEYCLKNLMLKKDTSCKEERYSNEDCMEERPLWRQAFAQALSEIGLDLGGDVHKRLNFIKTSDPEESVRKAAAEAYTSVRRQRHHNEDDPVKGMLVAFWWLRLAQRKSLGLEVDAAGATKTRRNELRYASQVREVVYEIQEISTQFI